MRWSPDQIQVQFVEGDEDARLSEGDVITIRFLTPMGPILVMGEVDIEGRTLVLEGAHIQGEGAIKPNDLGPGNILALARVVLERMDLDEARIEGAPRTTGANPGRRPRPFRVRRHPAHQAE